MEPLNGKTFLVTGGNGYIGSHMCKLLVAKGAKVHILDNFCTSPKRKVHSYGVFHDIDIGDAEAIVDRFKGTSIDGVFHFAARALVGESEADPLLYYRENVSKSIRFYEACKTLEIKKLVFSSTCATFGHSSIPITEDTPQRPINTYGRSKLINEQILRDLSEKGLIDVVVFRYFNASGCSHDGELGENHSPETHLIPNLCLAARAGKPINVFGADYDTRDGSAIRDYIHVEDLVEAHLRGYDYLCTKNGYFDFNLGTETGYSVLEVVSEFEKVIGSKLEVCIKGKRCGDPSYLVSSSEKSRQKIGFTAKYSISDGIRTTLDWFNGSRERFI